MTNPTAYGNLASIYRAMGEVEKARAVTEAFVKRNPENATGHAILGVALIGLGRNEEAIRELSQATLLGLDNPRRS